LLNVTVSQDAFQVVSRKSKTKIKPQTVPSGSPSSTNGSAIKRGGSDLVRSIISTAERGIVLPPVHWQLLFEFVDARD
jgi:hypothetical protein